MQPERVQRSRQKGFKMIHPNGLPNYYVGRPGKYGNPFKLIGDAVYVDASHRRVVMDKWIYLCQGTEQTVQDLYRMVITDSFSADIIQIDVKSMYDINYWVNKFELLDLEELRGNNLYCFCGKDDKCHADVLLELANK